MSQDHTHSRAALGLFEVRCGKNRYQDKKAAVSEINRLKKVRGRHGRPEWLRAYHCDDCNGWHITKGIDKATARFSGIRSRSAYKFIKKRKPNGKI